MLGWKDLAATLLVTAAAIVFASFAGAIGWTAFADPRVATLALGFVGLAACIVGSVDVTSLRGSYMASLSIVGGFMAGIAVIGVLFGWSWAPALLMSGIAVMWLVTTARHAMLPRDHVLST